jgi:non-heme chloroperoxidase
MKTGRMTVLISPRAIRAKKLPALFRTAILLPAAFVLCACSAFAQDAPAITSGFVTVADGVQIHYLEAGKSSAASSAPSGGAAPAAGATRTASTDKAVPYTPPGREPVTLLFIPGWTMTADIWRAQIEFFAKNYRVVAMDPRGQGDSTKVQEGLYPAGRARDIHAVIEQLHLKPVVLIGWSMGVEESIAYVTQFGTTGIAGFVMVDGIAGGMDPDFAKTIMQMATRMNLNRRTEAAEFVKSMYLKPQSVDYIIQVTADSMKTPTASAIALIVSAFGMDYRPALGEIDRPTLIVASKSPFLRLLQDMQQQIKGARLEVFDDAGHALFVDDAARFNALVLDFIQQLPPAAN